MQEHPQESAGKPPAGDKRRARPDGNGSARTVAEDEIRLIEALRAGDEAAFESLMDRYQSTLLRMALMYTPNRAVAEEVVQDTWLGVLNGIHRFEGRSSLKTWIFRILMNRARTIGQRESRTIPFSSLVDPSEPAESAVDPERFLPADHPQAGYWLTYPRSWGEDPEGRLLMKETLAHVAEAIQALLPAHREVITLRDVAGWSAAEVSDALEISDANQRVILHRARSRVRQALEDHLGVDGV